MFSSSKSHRPRVMVAVADGSEEIEAVSVIDILVRAEAEITVVKVPSSSQEHHSQSKQLVCKMSRGVKLVSIMILFTDLLGSR